jgi:hypothetical protein
MSDVRDVLSALMDREPVDADLLARVLEDPANRALLVDFVRLRTAILADEPGEPPWVPAQRRPTSAVRRPSPWLRRAAAALLLVGAGAGGGVWIERLATQERPPEPTRIVRLQPVARP